MLLAVVGRVSDDLSEGVANRMRWRHLTLISILFRLVVKRRLWFLIPTFVLLVVAAVVMFLTETPALIPFFYAIF
jgi:hypothetical protein